MAHQKQTRRRETGGDCRVIFPWFPFCLVPESVLFVANRRCQRPHLSCRQQRTGLSKRRRTCLLTRRTIRRRNRRKLTGHCSFVRMAAKVSNFLTYLNSSICPQLCTRNRSFPHGQTTSGLPVRTELTMRKETTASLTVP